MRWRNGQNPEKDLQSEGKVQEIKWLLPALWEDARLCCSLPMFPAEMKSCPCGAADTALLTPTAPGAQLSSAPSLP